MLSAIIIFISAGLLVYWISRMRILWHCSQDKIYELLETDLVWCRTFWWRWRSVILPPISLRGRRT
jgi:hypothetical protein